MKLYMEGPLADEGRSIINQLNKHGYAAYMVGGSVRDTLLKRPIHDVDIATSALPADVASLFEHVIPTGEKHGTMTVMSNGIPIEVTTFRLESEYVNYRKPEQVEYIDDIVEDLRRRDFTMNALALSADGELLDPFGGQADMAAGRIRSVGDAATRFHEDALRMLRGIRFASVLGMRLAKGVWRGMLQSRELLQHIAMERVQSELWKLLEGPAPQAGVALLARSGLLGYAKEPLGFLARPAGPAWQRCCCALAAFPDPVSPETRFALLALGHGADAPEAEPVTRALRLSGAQQNAILGVLRAYARLSAAADVGADVGTADTADPAARALREACARAVLADGEPALRAALACRRALQVAAPDEPVPAAWNMLLRDGEAWLAAMPVRKLTDLAVSGNDVLAVVNRPAGPWMRACLEQAWLAAATLTLPNTAEALLTYIRRMMAEEGRELDE
ncbi:CCA tRNA nucleotidyltransferase [Paenibacillus marinisediminis]